MKAPLITVDNLCMDFDGQRVLKNISFEIAEGEILGIIGRSGAGKTVLMHLMRGVEQPPTSGTIVYHVAACGTCDYMDVGSAAGKPCSRCGAKLTALNVDLWNEKDEELRRRLMRRTAIMFQRTFALYGDDRVI
ncbi:MAG: ATP-binding cassette domain-containing protein, partial [Methanoregula sp.]|nr:ATP-binding cassette domain-containing protein [Methanoregula sp.]